MQTKTYTAEYHDKTMDFRVVRWQAPINGVRIGDSIDRFDTEDEAMEVAADLNRAEEFDLYNNQSCEFDTWPIRSSIGWQYYQNLYNPSIL